MGPRAGLAGHGKSRPLPEFEPETIHPVSRRYTAIPVRLPAPAEVNLLATDFFFQILAHPVFKM